MKTFYLSDRNIEKLGEVLVSQSFDKYTILRIDGMKVMFFHNDIPNSKDGINYKMIELFKTLHKKNKADRFICCYPEVTGDVRKYCFMGKNFRGEIESVQDDNNYHLITLRKKKI